MSEAPKQPILRPIAYAVHAQGEPLFGENTITVKIDDDAAGEFIALHQSHDREQGEDDNVQITFDEWPLVNEAVRRLKAASEKWGNK